MTSKTNAPPFRRAESAPRATLGVGLEALVDRFADIEPRNALAAAAADAEPHVDLVIVGSGYGAAIAAREFAGCQPPDRVTPLSICILERGSEYSRGAFPARLAELPGHIRFTTPAQTAPRGERTGLFDVRIGPDALAVVANGVGGGSLINAGVMLRPHGDVLARSPWPQPLHPNGALDRHFDTVERWLRVEGPAHGDTIDPRAASAFAKTRALDRLGGGRAVGVPITVALGPGARSAASVPLEPCIGCGDCATGCNHGAKHSLDVGLLRMACETEGVALYTGATVLRLERGGTGAGWTVVVQHTDEMLRRRQGVPFRLRARRVVLAAGTFGSTEILLRSQRRGLALSSLLGRRFSANGDLLASVHDAQVEVNAVADERTPPASRHVGPTITAMLDRREPIAAGGGFVVQDLAVPGPLRRAFGEVFTTADRLHQLGRFDRTRHLESEPDRCSVDPATIARSLPVAMVGHDAADGILRLIEASPQPGAPAFAAGRPDDADDGDGDGALGIRWPALRNDGRFDAQHATLGALASANLGARLLPNPLWQLLPATAADVLEVPKGPLLTVHPLGGVPMGDDREHGVVDHLGRVFDPAQPGLAAVHDGLVVLDGSIVPTSLGINPALTIAALAQRAASRLRAADAWNLGEPRPAVRPRDPLPPYRLPPDPPPRPRPTEIELVERMGGPARLRPHAAPVWVELTLFSRPTPIDRLMQPMAPRRLAFDPDRSRLRVLAKQPSALADASAADGVLLVAPLGGHLDVFTPRPTHPWLRTLRGLAAWFRNRGLRDIVQAWRAPRPKGQSTWQTLVRGLTLVRNAIAMASRAGAVREIRYRLEVAAAPSGETPSLPRGTRIEGVKTLTYRQAANPFDQLLKMRLEVFPGLRSPATLALQLPFLAEQRVPLLRVVRQENQPDALIDVAAFVGYVARTLVDGHLWSFRKPDAPDLPLRRPQRLPGAIPGAPEPVVHEIEVAQLEDGARRTTVNIRLTRYRPERPRSELPPVLLIHGYSASGTTFAHPTLEPGLMRYLTAPPHRRDVWILDLRSSCGMPTAAHGWAFETMGAEDIPVAIDTVLRATGARQVDVVAHCMGVAMFFMGLLGTESAHLDSLGAHAALRGAMWRERRIRRLVMSQVGPAVLLTPGNIARAYLMRYVKAFIDGGGYRFSGGRPGALPDQLLDRVLAAMPYPAGEFALENPFWPPGARRPWVGTRHRIDALFGQVFSLANLSDATLACLDDFFGPFSVDTVSQVMHFAGHRLITDRTGFNRFLVPKTLRERLTFPMLSVHARDNGLADAATAGLLQSVMGLHAREAGGSLRSVTFPKKGIAGVVGHQDSLIGNAKTTAPVLAEIGNFLNEA